MGTTNYYSIGGTIVSEVDAGVRVDYLRDAFGSTVGTVSQAGSLQATLEYKPFGSILASSGTTPDLTYRGARCEHNVADGSAGSLFLSWHHLYPAAGSDFATVLEQTWATRTLWAGMVGQRVPVCGSMAAPWTALKVQSVWGMTDWFGLAGASLHYACFRNQSYYQTIWQVPYFNMTSSDGIIAQQVNWSLRINDCHGHSICGCSWTSKAIIESWPVAFGIGATQPGTSIPPTSPNCSNSPTVCWLDLYGWQCGLSECSPIAGSFGATGYIGYYDGCEAPANIGYPNANWQTGGGGTSNNACAFPWGYLAGMSAPSGYIQLRGATKKALNYNTSCCTPESATQYSRTASWYDPRVGASFRIQSQSIRFSGKKCCETGSC